MKALLLILTLTFFATTVYSQNPDLAYRWEKIHISSDSLRPLWIGFIDSTTGYLCCFTHRRHPDDIYNGSRYKYVLFITNNGGKSWNVEKSMPFFPPDSEYAALFSFLGIQRYYYFPTKQDRYIYFPHYDQTRTFPDPIGDVPYYRIWYTKSHNGGITWDSPKSDPWGGLVQNPNVLTAVLGPKDLIFYSDTGSRRNHLFRSIDDGATIPYSASDEIFARTIRPDTTGKWADTEAHFQFEISDPFNWTAVVIRGGIDNLNDTSEFYQRFPRGLRTLVTSNGGKNWQLYSTAIPNETDFPLSGDLQYIKGTPNLYYFSSWSSRIEGYLSFDDKNSIARPMLGINFCYSSDYGKTWKIDTTFGQRRRAYEAVQKDELWFTLPKKETGRDDDPAYIITRTTDGGMTYEFDTTTLTHFEQKLDGRIIIFSDPRHGWIVATGDNHKDLYILRYDANEQPKGVEDDIIKGYYGIHYTLYPNPANEIARLSMYKYLTLKDVSVYNVFGTEVPLGYRIDGSDVELDVRNLPIGHYTLRVRHNWGVSVIPLVVMR